MAAANALPSAGNRWRDIVCADCGWRLVRLRLLTADVPESPEVRSAVSRQFGEAHALHHQACAGVVLITVDVTGLPPFWRPFTTGDLERLSFDLYGRS